jgi:hypothetical protein
MATVARIIQILVVVLSGLFGGSFAGVCWDSLDVTLLPTLIICCSDVCLCASVLFLSGMVCLRWLGVVDCDCA